MSEYLKEVISCEDFWNNKVYKALDEIKAQIKVLKRKEKLINLKKR